MVLASDLLPYVELKESDRKKLQGELEKARADLESAKNSVANLIRVIETGLDTPAIYEGLKAADFRRIEAQKEVTRIEAELALVEERKASRTSNSENIQALAKAIKEKQDPLIREKLRYALSRSVDRIVLEDSEKHRTVRLEVGQQATYIDFCREELSFSLRGKAQEFNGQALKRTSTGGKKPWIP